MQIVSIKKVVYTISIILLISTSLWSQEDTLRIQKIKPAESRFNADFGLGYGLAYAGFLGAQLQYTPIENFGFFASGGYCVFTLGWQLGIVGYLIPKEPSHPVRAYLSIKYGTIAAKEVHGNDKKNKSYYGITPGIGLEVRFGKTRKHGFNIDIMFPFPVGQFKEDFDKFGGNWFSYNYLSGINGKSATPMTPSIGYHFEM